MNLRFEYLYRDAGNYKNWGDVVFLYSGGCDASYLAQKVRTSLIDGEFFVAEKAGVPDLKFPIHVDSLDHEWHEFHAFIPTNEEPNDTHGRELHEFIECLKYAATL